ncbi:uncharacterized protein LAESUDRAFT_753756 [Laetiporus sulphureus 93-53]|uniref:Cytochrome c oxidase subunit 8, mitochondrial n=1 Tax=Laetiporus sulphureus 93-53 TaxID=1314785 RepID=A0A165I803_9APHY|nr:uncharacterized protein LAESUDRAFT_753756 [Laetiporus sulphureus 93-53]KZT12709.1 hypothetical protein LAESUDRAFT_753756 [Laetiporus sulphureus 93-53]
MIAARASLPLRRAVARSPVAQPMRFSHAHAGPGTVPFNGKSPWFGLQLVSYLGLGFVLPFVAAAYQLKKSTAST